MTNTPIKTVRLSVPVTPEVQATFQRLAEASGRSMAASLAQWLVDTQQAADLMAENIVRLRSSPGDVVTRIKLHTASLEDFAEQAIQDAMDRADRLELEDGLDFQQGKGGRMTLARDARSATPPSSNTGGKGTKPTGGKDTKASAIKNPIQAYADTNGVPPSKAKGRVSPMKIVK